MIKKIYHPRVASIARVASDLILRPSVIPDYLITMNREPVEIGLPWISFGAIAFLRKFLQPSMSVFEYGSGGSTLFFAKLCNEIATVEDNYHWATVVRNRLQGLGLAEKVEILVKPTPEIMFDSDGDPIEEINFGGSEYVRAFDGRGADVVIIDGSDKWGLKYRRRTLCFRHVEPLMKTGAIIILDDSWAYPELRDHNCAKSVRRFRGVGPCRMGVTSTDVFFY